MKKPSPKTLFLVEICIAMLLWGASWGSAKITIDYTSNEIIAFWRFLFVVATFIPLIIIMRVPLKLSYRNSKIVLLAALINTFYTVIFLKGITQGFAGAGGVIVTTLMPIITFLFSFLLYKRRSNRFEIFGLFLGIISGIFLLGLHDPSLLFQNGTLYFVACAFVWSALTLVLQQIGKDAHPIATNCCVNFIGMIIYYLFVYDDPALYDVFEYDHVFWLGLLFGACCSTAIGTTLYYRAINALGSAKASAFTLIVPCNAVLTSWWLLDETPTLNTIIGGSIAILAIYFINIYKPRGSV